MKYLIIILLLTGSAKAQRLDSIPVTLIKAGIQQKAYLIFRYPDHERRSEFPGLFATGCTHPPKIIGLRFNGNFIKLDDLVCIAPSTYKVKKDK